MQLKNLHEGCLVKYSNPSTLKEHVGLVVNMKRTAVGNTYLRVLCDEQFRVFWIATNSESEIIDIISADAVQALDSEKGKQK